MEFETILPFLKPIEHLILDPDISEIMVNAGSKIFVEKNGQLAAITGITIPEQALFAAVKNIARRLGDDISEFRPTVIVGTKWQAGIRSKSSSSVHTAQVSRCVANRH